MHRRGTNGTTQGGICGTDGGKLIFDATPREQAFFASLPMPMLRWHRPRLTPAERWRRILGRDFDPDQPRDEAGRWSESGSRMGTFKLAATVQQVVGRLSLMHGETGKKTFAQLATAHIVKTDVAHPKDAHEVAYRAARAVGYGHTEARQIGNFAEAEWQKQKSFTGATFSRVRQAAQAIGALA